MAYLYEINGDDEIYYVLATSREDVESFIDEYDTIITTVYPNTTEGEKIKATPEAMKEETTMYEHIADATGLKYEVK